MYGKLWHSLYSQMFNQLSVVTLASISMSPSGRFYVLGVLSYIALLLSFLMCLEEQVSVQPLLTVYIPITSNVYMVHRYTA